MQILAIDTCTIVIMYVWYIGHITTMSIEYDRTTHMITCTTNGGPATDVTWFKESEKISVAPSNRGTYEHSQIITNTVRATYKNRLRIVDKSSETAGTYTCEVRNPRGSMNESLYIQDSHKTTVTYSMHESFS